MSEHAVIESTEHSDPGSVSAGFKHPGCPLCQHPNPAELTQFVFGSDSCSGGFVKLILHGRKEQTPVVTVEYELSSFHSLSGSAIARLRNVNPPGWRGVLEPFLAIHGSVDNHKMTENVRHEIAVGSFLVLGDLGRNMQAILTLPIVHLLGSHVLTK